MTTLMIGAGENGRTLKLRVKKDDEDSEVSLMSGGSHAFDVERGDKLQIDVVSVMELVPNKEQMTAEWKEVETKKEAEEKAASAKPKSESAKEESGASAAAQEAHPSRHKGK